MKIRKGFTMKRFHLVLVVMMSLPLWAQLEPDRVFPRLLTHIPKFEQGFQATILLKNEAKLAKEIYFIFYNEAGEIIQAGDPIRFRVEAGETKVLDGKQTFPQGTSHATVHGSARVRVSVMYGAQNNEDSANALLHENQLGGQKFLIYPTSGNPSQGYWEGLALVNVAGEANDIHFQLSDMEGNLIQQLDFNMAPMAKMVHTLEALFGDSTAEQRFQIDVTSSKPMNMVMLTGNADRQDFSNVYPEAFETLEPLQLTDDIVALPKAILSIEEVNFVEEVLTVSTLLPNPCHNLELFWTGGIKESFPPQVDLYLVSRDTSDVCIQPITRKTRSFDLTPIVNTFINTGGDKGDSLIINLRDKDHREIIYVYNFLPVQ